MTIFYSRLKSISSSIIVFFEYSTTLIRSGFYKDNFSMQQISCYYLFLQIFFHNYYVTENRNKLFRGHTVSVNHFVKYSIVKILVYRCETVCHWNNTIIHIFILLIKINIIIISISDVWITKTSLNFFI